MSKKKKYQYVDSGMKVVAVGETITFDKKEEKEELRTLREKVKRLEAELAKEEDHMDKEWFYLNDITWYKSTDGRTVAPVKGVVKNVGRPILNSDYVLVSVAEKAIVDAAPFGACYEHDKLMALCARVKLDAFANKCDASGREPYVLASEGDQNSETKFKHGGVYDVPSKVVETENEEQKSCTDEENKV